ncbi:MAG: hypothetical protein JST92_04630, partial [Deltaproteobacteria bacterium]|nr:hypothetical protein [Deltaproteobacteria bacterium]
IRSLPRRDARPDNSCPPPRGAPVDASVAKKFSAFWTEFDKKFMKPTDGGTLARVVQQTVLREVQRLRSGAQSKTEFLENLKQIEGPLRFITTKQDEFFRKLGEGDEALAFALLGAGVLVNSERSDDMVHKIGVGAGPPSGYHVWHASIYCAKELGALEGNEASWLKHLQHVGVAWEIQSILKPEDENQQNPPLPQDAQDRIIRKWEGRGFDEIARAFDSRPYPQDMERFEMNKNQLKAADDAGPAVLIKRSDIVVLRRDKLNDHTMTLTMVIVSGDLVGQDFNPDAPDAFEQAMKLAKDGFADVFEQTEKGLQKLVEGVSYVSLLQHNTWKNE